MKLIEARFPATLICPLARAQGIVLVRSESHLRKRSRIFVTWILIIGLRFGLLQVLAGLASILREYQFTINERTGDQLILNPNSFILSTLNTIWLNVTRIES